MSPASSHFKNMCSLICHSFLHTKCYVAELYEIKLFQNLHEREWSTDFSAWLSFELSSIYVAWTQIQACSLIQSIFIDTSLCWKLWMKCLLFYSVKFKCMNYINTDIKYIRHAASVKSETIHNCYRNYKERMTEYILVLSRVLRYHI